MAVRTTKKPLAGPAGDVLLPAEAASLLRVDEADVLAEAVAGRLPGRCIAGQWRFSRATLIDWLANGEPAESELDAAHRRHFAAITANDSDAEGDAFLEILRAQRAEANRYHERRRAAGE